MKIEIVYIDKIKDFKQSIGGPEVFVNRSEKIDLKNENLDSCKTEITKWIEQNFVDHQINEEEWVFIPIQNILKIKLSGK